VAGPSTSERTRIEREPRRLRRQEFVSRLFARVQDRYGLELDEAWLHDLIKDGLVPGADDREPNVGLRPVYTYGFRSYRRALQIARLRREGFVERDAIRIQLFLRGYGEHDIRQPLWNQYSKHGRSLLAQIRSGYIDNWKDVPEKHKSSLIRAMGPLDAQLASAGFQLPPDLLINWRVRQSKHPRTITGKLTWHNGRWGTSWILSHLQERSEEYWQGRQCLAINMTSLQTNRTRLRTS
jgi:hypothetical protein